MPVDAVDTTAVELARISKTRRANMVGESVTEFTFRNTLKLR